MRLSSVNNINFTSFRMIRGTDEELDLIRDAVVDRSINIVAVDEVKRMPESQGVHRTENINAIHATAELYTAGCPKVLIPKQVFPVASITRDDPENINKQFCLLATEENADFIDSSMNKIAADNYELAKRASLPHNGEDKIAQKIKNLQGTYKRCILELFERQKQNLLEATDVIRAIRANQFDFAALKIIR